MKENTYNGWTNYATWRVNLELIDGMELSDVYEDLGEDVGDDVVKIADNLKSLAEDVIVTQSNGLAQSYAFAFLSDVNWYEIAESLINNHKENKGE